MKTPFPLIHCYLLGCQCSLYSCHYLSPSTLSYFISPLSLHCRASTSSTGCGLNCHKGCAINIPNNCTRSRTTGEAVGSGSFSRKNKKEMWSGRPLWVDRAMRDRPQLPHTFVAKTYTTLTVCHYCKKLVCVCVCVCVCVLLFNVYVLEVIMLMFTSIVLQLKGLFRQGVQCKDCKINCHKKCSKESIIGRDCMGEMYIDYQSSDSNGV